MIKAMFGLLPNSIPQGQRLELTSQSRRLENGMNAALDYQVVVSGGGASFQPLIDWVPLVFSIKVVAWLGLRLRHQFSFFRLPRFLCSSSSSSYAFDHAAKIHAQAC